MKGITNPGIRPLTISGPTWASVYSATQITSPVFSVVMALFPPLHHAQPFPIRELVPNPKLPTVCDPFIDIVNEKRDFDDI